MEIPRSKRPAPASYRAKRVPSPNEGGRRCHSSPRLAQIRIALVTALGRTRGRVRTRGRRGSRRPDAPAHDRHGDALGRHRDGKRGRRRRERHRARQRRPANVDTSGAFQATVDLGSANNPGPLARRDAGGSTALQHPPLPRRPDERTGRARRPARCRDPARRPRGRLPHRRRPDAADRRACPERPRARRSRDQRRQCARQARPSGRFSILLPGGSRRARIT